MPKGKSNFFEAEDVSKIPSLELIYRWSETPGN
jgi:hypothetical protein